MMQLLSIVLLVAFPSPSIDDFSTHEKECTLGVEARNDLKERDRCIELAASFQGIAATKVLVKALTESTRHEESLDQRFGALTKELENVLDGTVDKRLAGEKKNAQLLEREELGREIIQESDLCFRIVDHLSRRMDAESQQWIASLANKDSNWRARASVVDALGKIGNSKYLKELHVALQDKDPRVRTLAAESVGRIPDETSVDALAPLLEDGEWQVRSATVEAFLRIKSRQAVKYLVPAMDAERGRLRHEVYVALQLLTGIDLGEDPSTWARWWQAAKDNFLSGGPVSAGPARVAAEKADRYSKGFTYYGIKTFSQKVIFVLDISDSMNDDAEETILPDDLIPKRTGNLRPKLQVALDQFTRVIAELPEEATFNIIVYNKYVRAWQKKLMKATRENKEEALNYLLSLKAKEATNIFDALEMAFKFAGKYSGDKYAPSAVDTIFFLTDGKATDGRFQKAEDILREIQRINRGTKVTIHAIGIGYLHDKPFLEALAEQNGGKYVNLQ